LGERISEASGRIVRGASGRLRGLFGSPPAKEGNECLSSANAAFRSTIAHAEASETAENMKAELLAMVRQANAKREKKGKPLIPETPGFLRSALRAKKYQLDKAFNITAHYTDFVHQIGWLDNDKMPNAKRSSPELKTCFNMLLPQPDIHGNVVLTQQLALLDLNLAGASLESYQKAGYYLLHRALQRREAQLGGIALLLDFRGFGWSLFRKVGFSDFRRGVSMLQDCFPSRLSVIYILHEPRWLGTLVRIIRPLLSNDSLQQKFVLMGSDYSKLYEHIPPEQLPTTMDVGGKLDVKWDEQVNEWVEEEKMFPENFLLTLLLENAIEATAPSCKSEEQIA